MAERGNGRELTQAFRDEFRAELGRLNAVREELKELKGEVRGAAGKYATKEEIPQSQLGTVKWVAYLIIAMLVGLYAGSIMLALNL
ncbi:MAG: hypothetical protein OXN95_08560 [bacterium]|nr:hypothetical protein [bacterium]MDE2935546.1 hypothetical protein [Chloroflexota bacterium]